MNNEEITIKPDDFILSVLSSEERLEAALEIAKSAFQNSNLTMQDVENAVESLRRKTYEQSSR